MTPVVDIEGSIRYFEKTGADPLQTALALHTTVHLMWQDNREKILQGFVYPCKKDCWFCCCQHPSIHWYEGLVIANHLLQTRPAAQNPDLYQQLAHTADAWMEYLHEHDYFSLNKDVSLYDLVTAYWKGKTWQQSVCPLLQDKRCSIYDLRPSTCFTYHTSKVCPDPREYSQEEYDAFTIDMIDIPVMREISESYELIFFQACLKSLPLPALPLPASIMLGLGSLTLGFDELLKQWGFKKQIKEPL